MAEPGMSAAEEKAAAAAASPPSVPTAVEVAPPPHQPAAAAPHYQRRAPQPGHAQPPRVDVDAGETLVVAAAGAPVFLGAWRGRHPINVQCGACGYTGQSVLKKKWGAAATTWAVMTLGFGAPWGKCVAGDIQHLCPNCNRLLAKSAPL